MRIFYASDQTPNSSLNSNLWKINLYMPLVDLGHEVIEFQYDLRKTFQNLDAAEPAQKAFIDRNRPLLSKELLKQIRKVHAERPVDLFFSYFYDACVLPEAIEEIKSMGIKTVNWYCNGSYQLYLVSEIAPHYDWCLVPEKFRMDDYIKMGANPIYCQEAANPNVYKPYAVDQEYDVTFVGQAYGERPAYIKYLLEQGIDIRVWGFGWESCCSEMVNAPKQFNTSRIVRIAKKLVTIDGWQSVPQYMKRYLYSLEKREFPVAGKDKPVLLPSSIIGGTLSDMDMIRMYSRTKINLGFSSCGETHCTGRRILQVRLRDFEVPMSGGFYMVEYMEELEEFFLIDKEIVCYRDMEEMAEKIRFYLTHDSERERIRKAGHERCLKDHTWHKRFEMAFTTMGLPVRG